MTLSTRLFYARAPKAVCIDSALNGFVIMKSAPVFIANSLVSALLSEVMKPKRTLRPRARMVSRQLDAFHLRHVPVGEH